MGSTVKKIIVFSAFCLVLVGAGAAVAVRADKYGTEATRQATDNFLPDKIQNAKTIPELVGVTIASVLGLFGIIFFLLIFYAGFNWMVAQGNAEKIDQSKNTIQGAAIGLVIVLAAYAITNFVFNSLGRGDTSVSITSSDLCAASSASECLGKKNGDLCVRGSAQGYCSFDTTVNNNAGVNDPMACVCK